jgi:hypothetical protein
MSDVFLLGAGFSRAVSDAMPLLADLNAAVWTKVNLPQEKDFLRGFGDNIEMVLTYLAEPHPWLPEAENLRNRALFLDLSAAVRDVLLDAMASVARSPCPDWLLSLIDHWAANRAHVITLNYDTLVESAARLPHAERSHRLLPDHYYPFPMVPARREWDDFSFGEQTKLVTPSFTLYKLHGSINWLHSGSVTSAETIFYGAQDDIWTPYRDHGLGTTERVPMIVPPVAEKIGYLQHPHMRGMWRQAALAVQGADHVYCLGYSLPALDTTMRFFLRRNQPGHKTRFSVVDVCECSGHFREALPRESYEVESHYVRPDNPIPNFVRDLTN